MAADKTIPPTRVPACEHVFIPYITRNLCIRSTASMNDKEGISFQVMEPCRTADAEATRVVAVMCIRCFQVIELPRKFIDKSTYAVSPWTQLPTE